MMRVPQPVTSAVIATPMLQASMWGHRMGQDVPMSSTWGAVSGRDDPRETSVRRREYQSALSKVSGQV